MDWRWGIEWSIIVGFYQCVQFTKVINNSCKKNKNKVYSLCSLFLHRSPSKTQKKKVKDEKDKKKIKQKSKSNDKQKKDVNNKEKSSKKNQNGYKIITLKLPPIFHVSLVYVIIN